eukprot:jgi/Picre1/35199/NNA_002661.t1
MESLDLKKMTGQDIQYNVKVEARTRTRACSGRQKASGNPEPSLPNSSEISAQAKRIGKQLLGMSKSAVMKKDNSIGLIRTLAGLLRSSSQRSTEVKRAMGDFVKFLGVSDILKHRDREMKLYVSVCSVHVLRLHAPDTPFSDETLALVFHVFINAIKGLSDIASPFFDDSLDLLKIAAKIKCCLLMLDLEQADSLLLELCSTMFGVVNSDNYEEIVEPALDLVSTLVDESDLIPQSLLDCILGNLAPSCLGPEGEEVSQSAQMFAWGLLKRSRESMQPHVQRFLTQLDKANHLTSDYPQLVEAVMGRLNDRSTSVRLRVLQHAHGLVSSLPLFHQRSAVVRGAVQRLQDPDEKVRLAAAVAFCNIAGEYPQMVEDGSSYDALVSRLWDKKISVRKKVASCIGKLIKQWSAACEDSDAYSVGTNNKKRLIEFIVGLCKLTKTADPELSAFIEDNVFRNGVLSAQFAPSKASLWWAVLWSETQEQGKQSIIDLLKSKCTLQENMTALLNLRLESKAERTTRTSIHGLSHVGDTSAEMMPPKMTAAERLARKVKQTASSLKHLQKPEESLEKIFGMKDNNIFRNLGTMATLGTNFATAAAAAKELQSRLGSRGPTAELGQALSARMCPTLISPDVLNASLKQASESSKEYTFVLELSRAEPRIFVGCFDTLKEMLTGDDELAACLAAEVLANAGKFIFTSDQVILSQPAVEKLVALCNCGRPKASKFACQSLMYATRFHEDRSDILDGVFKVSLGALKSHDIFDDHSKLLSHMKVISTISRMDLPTLELYASTIYQLVMHKFMKIDLSSGKPLSKSSSDEPSWGRPSQDIEIKAELIKTLSQALVPLVWTKEPAPIVVNVVKQFSEDLQDLTDMDTSAPQFEMFKWKLRRVHWSTSESCPENTLAMDPAEYSEEEKLAIEKQHADASPDAGWIRLAAAKALFRLFRVYDGMLSGNDYLTLGLACQDSIVEVRQALLKKIESTVDYFQHHGSTSGRGARQRCAKMTALYALYGADPYEPNVKAAFTQLRKYVVKRRAILQKISLKRATSGDSGTMVDEMPEFSLIFLVYFMAHHPDYDAEAMTQITAGDELMALFKDSLQMFLEALVIPQSSRQKDKESLTAELKNNAGVALKILRQLKFCNILDVANEDIDAEASLNARQICDIGLSLTKGLLHEVSPIPGATPSKFSGPLSLPKKYFSPRKLTAEDKRIDGSDLPPQLKMPKLRDLFSDACGFRMRFKGQKARKKRVAKEEIVEQTKKRKQEAINTLADKEKEKPKDPDPEAPLKLYQKPKDSLDDFFSSDEDADMSS